MLIALIIVVASLLNSVRAADIPSTAQYSSGTPSGYRYLLVRPLEPDTTAVQGSDTLYPLVVSLHGKSLRGSNIRNLSKYGTIAAIGKGLKLPAYVVAPQCPDGQGWEPRRILSVVNDICSEYPIDTNRIYVIGMSMGGYGTFDFVGTYPEKIAAAIAMCGGGRQHMADELSQVPLWVIHGTSDVAVPISQSKSMVSAIRKQDGKTCYFTELPSIGHSPLAESYGHRKLYDWMFAHNKRDRSLDSVCILPPPEYRRTDFTWLGNGYSPGKKSAYKRKHAHRKRGKALHRRKNHRKRVAR